MGLPIRTSLLCSWANGSNPPSNLFSYTPSTATINWTDTNGSQSGNLAFFNAHADKPSVSDVSLDTQGITSISNLSDLPALQTLSVGGNPGLATFSLAGCTAMVSINGVGNGFTTLDLSPCINLHDFDLSNGTLSGLNLTGLTALVSATCSQNSLVAITGLSTCTALTTFIASHNLFASLNLNFMPAHVDTIDVSSNPNLTTLNTDSIVTVGNNVDVRTCPLLAALSFPLLTAFQTLASGQGLFANFCTGLLSFSAPNWVTAGEIQFVGCTSLPSCTLGALVTADDIYFSNCSVITSLSFLALVDINGGCTLTGNPLLASISMPSLATASVNFGGGAFGVGADTSLVSLTLSGVHFGGELSGPFATNLVTLNLGTATFDDSGNKIEFTGCALNQASIDAILHRCVVSGVTTMDIELGGGTNSTPSAGGLADKATLQGLGNTVVTN